jgi:hypothetical protein
MMSFINFKIKNWGYFLDYFIYNERQNLDFMLCN